MSRFQGTLDPDGVYRPTLFPYVSAPGGAKSRWRAVVDSGADRTVVSLQLVQTITGQDWSALPVGQSFIGLSGLEETRLAQLEVAWPTPQQLITSEVVVVRADIPILLGRNDFFSRYVIRFHWHQVPPTFDVDAVPPALRGTAPVGPGKRKRRRRK